MVVTDLIRPPTRSPTSLTHRAAEAHVTRPLRSGASLARCPTIKVSTGSCHRQAGADRRADPGSSVIQMHLHSGPGAQTVLARRPADFAPRMTPLGMRQSPRPGRATDRDPPFALADARFLIIHLAASKSADQRHRSAGRNSVPDVRGCGVQVIIFALFGPPPGGLQRFVFQGHPRRGS